MRVVHTIATLSKQAAGVFQFVHGLTQHLVAQGIDARVVAFDGSRADEQIWSPVPSTVVRTFGLRSFPVAPKLREVLAELNPDLIHCHGLWSYHGLAVPRLCRAAGIPFVLSPHGMLEPWAWRHRAWKKRPIWWAWERRFLRRAAALHATSSQEVSSLRQLGLDNPAPVLPVGVDEPVYGSCAASASEHAVKTVLFLSRIHPKKGLANLLRAWASLRPAGWRLLVAGPDEGGHLAELQKAVAEYQLRDAVEFVGRVDGAAKWDLLRSANLFVLPTYSENFGVVVAEAMAAGLPVITTKAAPWQELETHRCGWWIDVGPEPLAAALREATAASPETLREMGARGRELVRERYSWPKIAQDMKAVYEWVLGIGPKPENVRFL